jgi:hypothetical protein
MGLHRAVWSAWQCPVAVPAPVFHAYMPCGSPCKHQLAGEAVASRWYKGVWCACVIPQSLLHSAWDGIESLRPKGISVIHVAVLGIRTCQCSHMLPCHTRQKIPDGAGVANVAAAREMVATSSQWISWHALCAAGMLHEPAGMNIGTECFHRRNTYEGSWHNELTRDSSSTQVSDTSIAPMAYTEAPQAPQDVRSVFGYLLYEAC